MLVLPDKFYLLDPDVIGFQNMQLQVHCQLRTSYA